MRVYYIGNTVSGRPLLDRIAGDDRLVLVGLSDEVERAADGAARYNVDGIDAATLSDDVSIARIADASPDLLVNFDSLRLLPPAVFNLARVAAINFHPGPLPQYAGLHVHQWGIMNGETAFAISLHLIEDGIDTGDIVARRDFEITAKDTGLTVFAKCLREGVTAFADIIDTLAAGRPLTRKPQDLAQRHYYSAAMIVAARLDPTGPVGTALNFVRALSYWPLQSPSITPRLAWYGGEIEIVSAERGPDAADVPAGTIAAIDDGGIDLACADGTLRITRAMTAKGPVAAAEWAAANNLAVGQVLT